MLSAVHQNTNQLLKLKLVLGRSSAIAINAIAVSEQRGRCLQEQTVEASTSDKPPLYTYLHFSLPQNTFHLISFWFFFNKLRTFILNMSFHCFKHIVCLNFVGQRNI